MPTIMRFIEPCLPSPADRPPSGTNWIHEIKHDGYRLMARRDSVGVRLITRRGNDWSDRFPLVIEAESICLAQAKAICWVSACRDFESSASARRERSLL